MMTAQTDPLLPEFGRRASGISGMPSRFAPRYRND
jgi:hypothetical protein